MINEFIKYSLGFGTMLGNSEYSKLGLITLVFALYGAMNLLYITFKWINTPYLNKEKSG